MVKKDVKSSPTKNSEKRKNSPSRSTLRRNVPSTKSPSDLAVVTVSKYMPSRVSPIRTRSPGRRTSPGRVTSPEKTRSPEKKIPGRRTSPARRTSPGRKLSPGRPRKEKEKSPARKVFERKSPSRSSVTENTSSSKKATVQSILIDTDTESEEEYVPKEKPKATVTGRLRRLDIEDFVQGTTVKRTENSTSYTSEVRRLTRNSQPQEERVVHLKHYDVTSKKLGEFSDDEVTAPSKPPPKKKGLSISDFFGILFQFILTPFFVIGIYVFCTSSTCSFLSLPKWNEFNSWKAFFNLRAFLGYSIVAVSIALLGILPFGGRKVSSLPGKHTKFIYNTNGLFTLIVILLGCGGVQYFLFPLSSFITRHVLHLAVSAVLFGTLFSVYLYLRSLYAPISALNAAEVDTPALSGFYYGREVHPRLLNVLDLKLYTLRIYAISMVLVDLALLFEGLNLNAKLGPAIKNLEWKPIVFAHPTLLVIVALHLIYFIGHLVYEARAISSYFIQYESLGCGGVVGVLLYPFQLATQSKYILEHKVNYANWELIALCVLYLIGFVLFTISNNQKDAFRKNPYSAASAKFESIQTSQGKRILCSGWWGFVRQPNILGDLLVHFALLRFGFEAPPVIGVVLIILMLIERAATSQKDCKSKYGPAWDKYCQKVKYVLFPKVY